MDKIAKLKNDNPQLKGCETKNAKFYQVNDFSENEKLKGLNIGCYEELLYNGVNLIGISIPHFSVLVGQDYVEEDELDFEEEELPQYIYEYPHIGLQVWARGRLGLVISIMVNGVEHYID